MGDKKIRVSVPLRGMWFEMQNMMLFAAVDMRSFRPLTGNVV